MGGWDGRGGRRGREPPWGGGSGGAAQWRRAAEEAPEGGGCGRQVSASGPRGGVRPGRSRGGRGAAGGIAGTGRRSLRGSAGGHAGGGAPGKYVRGWGRRRRPAAPALGRGAAGQARGGAPSAAQVEPAGAAARARRRVERPRSPRPRGVARDVSCSSAGCSSPHPGPAPGRGSPAAARPAPLCSGPGADRQPSALRPRPGGVPSPWGNPVGPRRPPLCSMLGRSCWSGPRGEDRVFPPGSAALGFAFLRGAAAQWELLSGRRRRGWANDSVRLGPEGAAGSRCPASFSGAEGGLSTAPVENVLNSFYSTDGNESSW